MKLKNRNQHNIWKSWDGAEKNAYKIFMDEGEKHSKHNFWAGHQYEMQKSRDGGRNAYKIFKSLVEEVNIPNTISYVELFMATMSFMKMKNNSSALRSSLVHFPAQASKN